jgi:hypothetical protein
LNRKRKRKVKEEIVVPTCSNFHPCPAAKWKTLPRYNPKIGKERLEKRKIGKKDWNGGHFYAPLISI